VESVVSLLNERWNQTFPEKIYATNNSEGKLVQYKISRRSVERLIEFKCVGCLFFITFVPEDYI